MFKKIHKIHPDVGFASKITRMILELTIEVNFLANYIRGHP